MENVMLSFWVGENNFYKVNRKQEKFITVNCLNGIESGNIYKTKKCC